MAGLLATHHAFVRHPIDLDDAARTRKRLEAVPGIGAVEEKKQRAFVGRDFRSHVVQVGGRTQDAQPPDVGVRVIVHIKKQCDQFGLAVGVDLAVARLAASAHGRHGRPARKIDTEFRFHDAGHFGGSQSFHHRFKGRAIVEARERETAGLGDFGEIRRDAGFGASRTKFGTIRNGNGTSVTGVVSSRSRSSISWGLLASCFLGGPFSGLT